MGPNRLVARSPQTDPSDQGNSEKKDTLALDNELKNRLENLNKLLQNIKGVLEQESFSTKRHAIDFVTDLRMKTKACHEIFRVARLLREPARESMLLKLRESVDALEEVFASRLGVKMN